MRKLLKRWYLKWIYRNCPGYIDHRGIRFHLDEGDSLRLYRYKNYSPYLVQTCSDLLPDDGVFVDAGASVGWFTCNVAIDRPKATVLSVEANPNQYKVLCKNCIQLTPNIIATNMGLWSSDGTKKLFIDPNHGSGARLYEQPNRPHTKIETRTLDTALKLFEIKRVDVLKIDCEGTEGHIIEGFGRLEVLRPHIILEFTPDAMRQAGSSPVLMWKRLHQYGHVYYLNESTWRQERVMPHQSMPEGNYLITPKGM